jgi:NAD(P)-dependent dehydrogenase (short-subunit alcohol dehydrogenase family)
MSSIGAWLRPREGHLLRRGQLMRFVIAAGGDDVDAYHRVGTVAPMMDWSVNDIPVNSSPQFARFLTILFTGASASLRGQAGYGAFNSAKVGLRTFGKSMAKEYGSEGIHVGHVVVDGAVEGDKIRRRFLEANSRRERLLDIERIVECYALLYRQHHKV